MWPYFVRRLISVFFALSFLLLCTFFFLRILPGNPLETEISGDPRVQAQIIKDSGLDLPIMTQFTLFIKNLGKGELGESYQYRGHCVKKILTQSLPISLALVGTTLILSFFLGIFLGAIHAYWEKSKVVSFLMTIALCGISIPSYSAASLLSYIFALKLHWLPPALLEEPCSFMLPISTLSWRPLGIFAQITKISIKAILSENYIRTAIGKGLSPISILFKHALKNSLIPLIASVGPMVGSVFTTLFLVETTFQIPGMGQFFVQSILNRDYPLVMGCVLSFGVLIITSNLICDFLLVFFEPRIRTRLSE